MYPAKFDYHRAKSIEEAEVHRKSAPAKNENYKIEYARGKSMLTRMPRNN